MTVDEILQCAGELKDAVPPEIAQMPAGIESVIATMLFVVDKINEEATRGRFDRGSRLRIYA